MNYTYIVEIPTQVTLEQLGTFWQSFRCLWLWYIKYTQNYFPNFCHLGLSRLYFSYHCFLLFRPKVKKRMKEQRN
jgi:hypothetical protein